MSIYNVVGNSLQNAFSVNGVSMTKLYDVFGNDIFGGDAPPSPGDYDEWTTEYEHTILLARNDWAEEYRADSTIVPFVVTTDQHTLLDDTINGSKFGGALYKYLSKAVNWDEVSASLTLGDVCGSYFSASSLTSMNQKLSVIPSSKRIDVPGNHDVAGAQDYPETMDSIFTYYFNNSEYPDFSRFEKRGFETMVDQVHHIRYVVLSSWYYNIGDTMASYRISSDGIEWLIDILGSDSENDIVIVSHIQPAPGEQITINPQVDGHPYCVAYRGWQAVGGNNLKMQNLLLARKNKTNGTITDADGVIHSFDFSGCTTDLLCTLHGHEHSDRIMYHCGVPTYLFDSYAKSSTGNHPMYFGNIDRTQQRIHLWKVETNNTFQEIIVPFTPHINPCTGIAYPDGQKNVTLTVGESMTLTPIISTEYEDDGTYPTWYPGSYAVRLYPKGPIKSTYVSAVNKWLNGGIITGNKAGTSIVTVWCGPFSDVCNVTVVDPPEEET